LEKSLEEFFAGFFIKNGRPLEALDDVEQGIEADQHRGPMWIGRKDQSPGWSLVELEQRDGIL
jgi:hypothetical protein